MFNLRRWGEVLEIILLLTTLISEHALSETTAIIASQNNQTHVPRTTTTDVSADMVSTFANNVGQNTTKNWVVAEEETVSDSVIKNGTETVMTTTMATKTISTEIEVTASNNAEITHMPKMLGTSTAKSNITHELNVIFPQATTTHEDRSTTAVLIEEYTTNLSTSSSQEETIVTNIQNLESSVSSHDITMTTIAANEQEGSSTLSSDIYTIAYPTVGATAEQVIRNDIQKGTTTILSETLSVASSKHTTTHTEVGMNLERTAAVSQTNTAIVIPLSTRATYSKFEFTANQTTNSLLHSFESNRGTVVSNPSLKPETTYDFGSIVPQTAAVDIGTTTTPIKSALSFANSTSNLEEMFTNSTTEYVASYTATEKKLYFEIGIVNKTYSMELGNSSSEAYKNLSNEVENDLKKILSNVSGISNIKVIAFRNGSIISSIEMMVGDQITFDAIVQGYLNSTEDLKKGFDLQGFVAVLGEYTTENIPTNTNQEETAETSTKTTLLDIAKTVAVADPQSIANSSHDSMITTILFNGQDVSTTVSTITSEEERTASTLAQTEEMTNTIYDEVDKINSTIVRFEPTEISDAGSVFKSIAHTPDKVTTGTTFYEQTSPNVILQWLSTSPNQAGTTTTLLDSSINADRNSIFTGKTYLFDITLANETYNTHLDNPSSEEYRILKNRTEYVLTQILKNMTGFLEVTVTGFSNGSVIVRFQVEVSSNATQEDIIRAYDNSNATRKSLFKKSGFTRVTSNMGATQSVPAPQSSTRIISTPQKESTTIITEMKSSIRATIPKETTDSQMMVTTIKHELSSESVVAEDTTGTISHTQPKIARNITGTENLSMRSNYVRSGPTTNSHFIPSSIPIDYTMTPDSDVKTTKPTIVETDTLLLLERSTTDETVSKLSTADGQRALSTSNTPKWKTETKSLSMTEMPTSSYAEKISTTLITGSSFQTKMNSLLPDESRLSTITLFTTMSGDDIPNTTNLPLTQEDKSTLHNEQTTAIPNMTEKLANGSTSPPIHTRTIFMNSGSESTQILRTTPGVSAGQYTDHKMTTGNTLVTTNKRSEIGSTGNQATDTEIHSPTTYIFHSESEPVTIARLVGDQTSGQGGSSSSLIPAEETTVGIYADIETSKLAKVETGSTVVYTANIYNIATSITDEIPTKSSTVVTEGTKTNTRKRTTSPMTVQPSTTAKQATATTTGLQTTSVKTDQDKTKTYTQNKQISLFDSTPLGITSASYPRGSYNSAMLTTRSPTDKTTLLVETSSQKVETVHASDKSTMADTSLYPITSSELMTQPIPTTLSTASQLQTTFNAVSETTRMYPVNNEYSTTNITPTVRPENTRTNSMQKRPTDITTMYQEVTTEVTNKMKSNDVESSSIKQTHTPTSAEALFTASNLSTAEKETSKTDLTYKSFPETIIEDLTTIEATMSQYRVDGSTFTQSTTATNTTKEDSISTSTKIIMKETVNKTTSAGSREKTSATATSKGEYMPASQSEENTRAIQTKQSFSESSMARVIISNEQTTDTITTLESNESNVQYEETSQQTPVSSLSTTTSSNLKISSSTVDETTNAIEVAEKMFLFEITLVNESYNTNLDNSNSTEYKSLKLHVETKLEKILLKLPGIRNISVSGFRNGSVIVRINMNVESYVTEESVLEGYKNSTNPEKAYFMTPGFVTLGTSTYSTANSPTTTTLKNEEYQQTATNLLLITTPQIEGKKLTSNIETSSSSIIFNQTSGLIRSGPVLSSTSSTIQQRENSMADTTTTVATDKTTMTTTQVDLASVMQKAETTETFTEKIAAGTQYDLTIADTSAFTEHKPEDPTAVHTVTNVIITNVPELREELTSVRTSYLEFSNASQPVTKETTFASQPQKTVSSTEITVVQTPGAGTSKSEHSTFSTASTSETSIAIDAKSTTGTSTYSTANFPKTSQPERASLKITSATEPETAIIQEASSIIKTTAPTFRPTETTPGFVTKLKINHTQTTNALKTDTTLKKEEYEQTVTSLSLKTTPQTEGKKLNSNIETTSSGIITNQTSDLIRSGPVLSSMLSTIQQRDNSVAETTTTGATDKTTMATIQVDSASVPEMSETFTKKIAAGTQYDLTIADTSAFTEHKPEKSTAVNTAPNVKITNVPEPPREFTSVRTPYLEFSNASQPVTKETTFAPQPQKTASSTEITVVQTPGAVTSKSEHSTFSTSSTSDISIAIDAKVTTGMSTYSTANYPTTSQSERASLKITSATEPETTIIQEASSIIKTTTPTFRPTETTPGFVTKLKISHTETTNALKTETTFKNEEYEQTATSLSLTTTPQTEGKKLTSNIETTSSSIIINQTSDLIRSSPVLPSIRSTIQHRDNSVADTTTTGTQYDLTIADTSAFTEHKPEEPTAVNTVSNVKITNVSEPQEELNSVRTSYLEFFNASQPVTKETTFASKPQKTASSTEITVVQTPGAVTSKSELLTFSTASTSVTSIATDDKATTNAVDKPTDVGFIYRTSGIIINHTSNFIDKSTKPFVSATTNTDSNSTATVSITSGTSTKETHQTGSNTDSDIATRPSTNISPQTTFIVRTSELIEEPDSKSTKAESTATAETTASITNENLATIAKNTESTTITKTEIPISTSIVTNTNSSFVNRCLEVTVNRFLNNETITITFPTTSSSEYASSVQKCSNGKNRPQAMRYCQRNSTWGQLYFQSCTDNNTELLSSLNVTSSSANSVLVVLSFVTSDTKLTGSEAQTVTKLLETIGNTLPNKVFSSTADLFLDTANKAINHQSSILMSETRKNNKLALAKIINRHALKQDITNGGYINDKSNFYMNVMQIPENTTAGFTFRQDDTPVKSDEYYGLVVNIPQQALDAQGNGLNSKIAVIVFKDGNLFPSASGSDLVGHIITIEIGDSDGEVNITNLNSPIKIELNYARYTTSLRNVYRQADRKVDLRASCVFYDYAVNDWSSNGGTSSSAANSDVTCNWNHATSFGVQLDPKFIDYKPHLMLMVGSGIATIALFVVVFIYLFFWRLREDPIDVITLNLSLTLSLAFLTYLCSGVLWGTLERPSCLALSAFHHFFLLSSFIWMMTMSLVADRCIFNPKKWVLRIALADETLTNKMIMKLCIVTYAISICIFSLTAAITMGIFEGETSSVNGVAVIHPDAYTEVNFCTVKDWAMLCGLALPAGICLLLSIIVDVRIVKALHFNHDRTKNKFHGYQTHYQIARELAERAFFVPVVMTIIWSLQFCRVSIDDLDESVYYILDIAFGILCLIFTTCIVILFLLRPTHVRGILRKIAIRSCCGSHGLYYLDHEGKSNFEHVPGPEPDQLANTVHLPYGMTVTPAADDPRPSFSRIGFREDASSGGAGIRVKRWRASDAVAQTDYVLTGGRMGLKGFKQINDIQLSTLYFDDNNIEESDAKIDGMGVVEINDAMKETVVTHPEEPVYSKVNKKSNRKSTKLSIDVEVDDSFTLEKELRSEKSANGRIEDNQEYNYNANDVRREIESTTSDNSSVGGFPRRTLSSDRNSDTSLNVVVRKYLD
ncbi:uncharacterized protein LOC120346183 isoform X2 [Styela clava]